MPEKPQPTPRDPYEMCPFRETFLLHFTEPDHQQAIRTVGDLVCQFVYEWSFFPKYEEPLIAAELKAAVVDLRALGVFLRETVAEVSGALGAGAGGEGRRLGRSARGLGGRD